MPKAPLRAHENFKVFFFRLAHKRFNNALGTSFQGYKILTVKS